MSKLKISLIEMSSSLDIFMLSFKMYIVRFCLFYSNVVNATKAVDATRPVTCVLNYPKNEEHAVCSLRYISSLGLQHGSGACA